MAPEGAQSKVSNGSVEFKRFEEELVKRHRAQMVEEMRAKLQEMDRAAAQEWLKGGAVYR